MVQKLFAFVDNTAAPDNPDTLANQEVLQPGHLITIYLKVKEVFSSLSYQKVLWFRPKIPVPYPCIIILTWIRLDYMSFFWIVSSLSY